MSKIYVVSIGPGGKEQMTYRAVAALESCDIITGYNVYIDLIKADFPGKKFIQNGMRKEVDRCRATLDEALKGQTVAIVSSGDAGVYGMAGIMYEVAADHPEVEIEVIPGITAACSGAAVLGAPLICDFCLISLSDLLTPWERLKTVWTARPREISALPSTIPGATNGPITCRRPATSCSGTRAATYRQGSSIISAAKANAAR